MNRRDFARLSALSLAAARLPAFAQGASTKPVGYCAIGLGTISNEFTRGITDSTVAKVTGLVSGHPEKAAMWAERLGVPKTSIYTYENMDRIRDNPAIDATYVGLPNSMHKEFTIRSAQAGKHVLCEKPMAISSAECREMIAACRKANVKLMIGYRCHYDPTYLAAMKLVQGGKLGEIQAFEGAFGFNAKPNQWRLTRTLGGGGSVMDVGIYPLNGIRFFSGEEPSEYKAYIATRDKSSGKFKEVEETVAWSMRLPSGILASCASTYGANMPGFLRINGTLGALELTDAYSYQGVKLDGHYDVPGGKGVTVQEATPESVSHFKLEGEHFARCIRNNRDSNTPGEEGLKDMIAIEKIYAAAGTPIA